MRLNAVVARSMKWRHVYRDRWGWVVVIRRRRRCCGRRYFSDRALGGREAALERARSWRDALLLRLPPATMIRARFAPNRSGTIGVQLLRERTRGGVPAPRWRATWYELDGSKGGRSFSVLKYGAQRAKALASECRAQVLKRLREERWRRRGADLARAPNLRK